MKFDIKETRGENERGEFVEVSATVGDELVGSSPSEYTIRRQPYQDKILRYAIGGYFRGFEHPTLSAHKQIRCQAFVAAIEEVEKKFGMRLPTNDRLPIMMKFEEGIERRVDEKGRVYAHDTHSLEGFENKVVGESWEQHVRRWMETGQ